MTVSSFIQDPAWAGDVSLSGPAEETKGGRGSWPRQLVFSTEVKDRLRMYLQDEITAFHNERSNVMEDWRRYQKVYWAEPESKERNFPFRRSANIVVPLGAIAVEAIAARMMNTLFAVKPFYSIRPKSGPWIQAAKPFEQYLQTEIDNDSSLRMFEFCDQSVLELIKLGTCVGKSGYVREIKKSLRTTSSGEENFYVETKNGAELHRVALPNFVMRLQDLDPQEAGIVGEKHEVTWGQLKKYVQSGRMSAEAVEQIKNNWVERNSSAVPNEHNAVQEQVEQSANVEPKWTQVFHFYEIWLSFDVDGDGWDEEIVVDFHLETGEFLSAFYNWYDDLHRPYRVCTLQTVEGIWPGLGVIKQTEQFQAQATTIHRQRLDNATLANMKQIVVRKSSGYGPSEPVFPGKIWFLEDPINDIREFALSEIYPSSYANEESVVRYFEKATGVNEVILGIPQAGTPGTATSDLTRLAEGNKRFDYYLKKIKRWLSLLGEDVVVNYQRFGNQQAHWYILEEDGQYVEQVLQMPSMLVRKGAIVDLTVTDSLTNRDVEQQTWMQLFQVISNYYGQIFQSAQVLAQLSGDPTVLMQVAQRAMLASDEALKRLLETFAEPDSERFSLIPQGPGTGANPNDTEQTPNNTGTPRPAIGTGTTGTGGPIA